jgi:diguanylate cyclase (GGDEF)-like protein
MRHSLGVRSVCSWYDADVKRRRRTLGHQTVKLNVQEVRETIARTREKRAALVVLAGVESDLGTNIVLTGAVTIGRDPTVELPLQDEGISRRHCRIRPASDNPDDGFVVEDLRSTNGTLLNGEPLTAPHKLRAGDRIFLGSCVLKFTDSDALEVGYHEKMDALVGTDDLTGLIAKRRFDAAYVRALDTARTAKRPLAILMLDLDNLKQINDTHGHPVGAYTIAEVGRLIGRIVSEPSQLSGGGAACRFGGDEFAIFLPGATKRAAVEVGETIRAAILGHRFEKDGVVVHPTMSIGVAAYPDDGKHPELLLRRADDALYRAKRGGRNRVEAYSPA